ncbi:MAG: hypothetical protein ABI988_01640 [Nitrospirota bacterium]
MEAPKDEGDKETHGKRKGEHQEKGKSGEDRKAGDHKGGGKYKDRENTVTRLSTKMATSKRKTNQ